MQQQQQVHKTREERDALVVDENHSKDDFDIAATVGIHNNPDTKMIIQVALSLDLHFLQPSVEKMFPNIDTASILTAYRKFLAIKTVFGDTSCPQELSPSPLVDQVWHLHLQRPGLYMAACTKIGRVIDHDPEAANDDVDTKQERLGRTKTAYRSLFDEEAPSDLWSYFAPGDTCILVKTLSGKTQQIFINLTDNVGYLKMKIQETEGTPSDLQKLIFAGRQLKDDHLLSDWKMKNGSVIHLVLKMGGC